MTKEELKKHCEKQIENCEMWAKYKREEPHGKVYEEHKLILELLEQETVSKEVYDHEYFLRKELEVKIDKLERQLDKIREQIKSNLRGVEITLEVLVENDPLIPKMEGAKDTLEDCLEIIDKAESEK